MKNKWIFYLFVLIAVGLSVFGVIYVVNSMSTETHSFSSDGYALYSDNKDTKPASYSFTNGTDYSYKKLKNNITFTSTDGNVAIDESTFIHYANKSYMPLKNVVGLDLSTIDSKIIFYYNIYKNTNYKSNTDFSLSENEENIILLTDESIGKKFAFNNFDIEVVDDKIITLTKRDENHTVLTFDVNSSNISDSTLSNIFRLTNDALILEYKDNNSNSYYYYILGNTNTDNRLGYSSDNFENKDDELSELHDITEFIQVNKNGEIDNSVRIKEIETFENRTLILMDNGLLFGSGKNDGYFVAVANNSSNELENTEILNEFTILNPSSISSKIDGITTTKNTDKSLVFLYNELYGYGFGSYFFLGMRNGSSFRNTDAEVIERFEDQSIDHKTGPDFYSYFCTKNCIYFINPIFDLIAHFYLSSESFENDSIAHVISSLLFLRDMSITYNEEAYNHIVNNLTILSDEDNPVFANMNHHIYNNIQNYLMHDAMLLMYSNDEEKYNAVSKFINLIGLMSENFSAMKTKKCKINDVPFDEFVRSINDINRKSNFSSEDNRNGIRFNPFRAR